jgi:peptidoglycan hydrolase CwlO-like protein
MIKNVLLMILPSVIILSLWYILVPNGKYRDEIKQLNAKNDSLRNLNVGLRANIEANQKLLVSSDNKIDILKKEDELLKSKVKTLNTTISKLKTNYEKANSHSNNFSTIDIQRYFSDSLDIR